jgi:DNA adenine methylase
MGCLPFLRWAGGKRWLTKLCGPLVAERLRPGKRYIEPFLGSGAMYFALAPQRALLGDVNTELIGTFRVVRDNADCLAQKLLKLPVTAREYARVRSWYPRTPLNCATRFIYLNRTAYGGLHRTNLDGEFNVPYGGGERNARKMVHAGILHQAAACLKSTDLELYAGDFHVPILHVDGGDVVYCDPTYRAVTRTVYDRYGPRIYSWDDQTRLARGLRKVYERGALVLISSQAWSGLQELFPEAGMIELRRSKGLGPTTSSGMLIEYLFVLDPEEDWPRWEKLGSVTLTKGKCSHQSLSKKSLSLEGQ